ncbi:MAG TPA: hypothetical protein VM802_03740 [Chitinophaga sp.]|nr:hypothetical protein [Chitinophaga sp.]HVI43947.1 hypothetical protein [Chitinophaga sp.]
MWTSIFIIAILLLIFNIIRLLIHIHTTIDLLGKDTALSSRDCDYFDL